MFKIQIKYGDYWFTHELVRNDQGELVWEFANADWLQSTHSNVPILNEEFFAGRDVSADRFPFIPEDLENLT